MTPEQEKHRQNQEQNGIELPTALSPLNKRNRNHNSYCDLADRNTAADDSIVPFIDKEDVNNKDFVAESEDSQPPIDHCNLVYMIFLLHGIGVLLPWNAFLTIHNDYFVGFKLNGTANTTEYRENFIKYFTAFAQIPNLVLSFLNLFVVIKGGLHRRIYYSLFVVALVCVITILFVFIDTEEWPFLFFVFTMFLVVLLNSANGIYQNSIWGLVADFTGQFTNAIVLGNNLCGILLSVIYILIIFWQVDIKWSASIFFGLTCLTVLCCIISFHFLPKLSYYKYYVTKAAEARQPNSTDILHEEEDVEDGSDEEIPQRDHKNAHRPSFTTYLAISKEAWRQLFDVFIIFFTTLAIFPSILFGIKFGEIDIYGNKETSQKLQSQLLIILNFNLFATLGTWIANFIQWPSPKYLTVAAVTRLFFIPLFLVCKNKENTVSLIENDWLIVLLITFMAITHGYWSSLAMMYAPKQVRESKSQIVGMMSGFFLVFGITMGIFFTFFESHIVKLIASIFA